MHFFCAAGLDWYYFHEKLQDYFQQYLLIILVVTQEDWSKKDLDRCVELELICRTKTLSEIRINKWSLKH